MPDTPEGSHFEDRSEVNPADDPIFHMILSAIEEELDKLSEEQREHAQAFSSPLDDAAFPSTGSADAASATPEPIEPERGTAAYDYKHGIPRF